MILSEGLVLLRLLSPANRVRHRSARGLAIGLILCIQCFISDLSIGATLQGEVVGIADGDTLTLLDSSKTQYKIRLAGIDAPEKTQPFGNQSRQALARLAFRQHVVVEWTKYDRYRRIIGKVRLDGHDLNLAQVTGGMAWHYKEYEREQTRLERSQYAAAESKAREAREGLWRDPAPVPPWDFRHYKRAAR